MLDPAKRSSQVWGGAAVATLVLGFANHFLNENAIAFGDPPEILPKPGDWPSLSIAEGMTGAFKVFFKDVGRHPWEVGIGLGLLLAGLAYGKFGKGLSAGAWARSWFRIFLGGMFLLAAYPKFSDPEGFALLVAQYQMLPLWLVPAFSTFLPAGEIVVGLGILFLPWEKDFSWMVALLWVVFILALGQALARGLGIACGCFDIEGATDAGETWFSLLRDIVLLVPTVAMALKGNASRPIWRLGR